MKIEIPDGFFPPPGVPFETENQKALGVYLHNSQLAILQVFSDGKWSDGSPFGVGAYRDPINYRLAPPTPRTVGPFESSDVFNLGDSMPCPYTAFDAAYDKASKSGFKRFRIHLTATAEEIL